MSRRFITVISWSWWLVGTGTSHLGVLESSLMLRSPWLLWYCSQKDGNALKSVFVTKLWSSIAALFSRWLGGKKRGRHFPSVRLRENTTSLFVANQSMAVYWYEIGLRCLVDLLDCCYCPPHPNTIFIFIFFPSPLTSNLSAIWSSHRLAARNKPGWWKQVDPGRGSVWKTTVVLESGHVLVSFSSPGHAYYSVVTVLSL